MGSKGSTSTAATTIPADVLSRYNQVNAQAQQTAAQPFQPYSQDASAFVAPLNQTQQQGISSTNQYATSAQPYYGAATSQLAQAQNSATPYYGAATSQLGQAQGVGGLLAGSSLGSLASANASAAGPQSSAAQYISGANSAADPYNTAASGNISQGLSTGAQTNNQALQQYQNSITSANNLGSSANGAVSSANGMAGNAISDVASGAQASQPYINSAGQGYTQAGLSSAGDLNQAGQYIGQGSQAVDPSNLDAAAIGKYLSPYLGTVLQGTAGLLNQNNQQQQAGQLGNAISSGAFGGDRAGIAAANLSQQQNLANASIYSGILNQGYGQALSTAQQQQQLGLGAAQANRTAQQQAADQSLALGQTRYGQAMTTAEQQAALGQQVFGQGATAAGIGMQGAQVGLQGAGIQAGLQQAALQGQLQGAQGLAGVGQQQFAQSLSGAQAQAGLGQQVYGQQIGTGTAQAALGQQLYGQGANTASQLAALGQQQYGQGANTATQLGALGQQVYGTGAATSQGLANLGTGAQAAGLSGAQAQLAAGQTAQQTQQAGQTALYNQYLQQQSYPFQVSQFLANIAEGTGALSGNTTTTNQVQNGVFSDRRLKEDIKPVGKTFDNQTIYSFRYKGEPQTEMGLIAQEVEKKHPHAVGLAGGFKTVDYGKATDDAAQRGHFASGGLASAGGMVTAGDEGQGFAYGGSPGFDPGLMQQIMSNYQSMYAPMASHGAGGPGATGGIVPQPNLPVGQLQTAHAPEMQMQSPVQTATDYAKAGDTIGQLGNKLGAWNYGGDSTDTASHGGLGKAISGLFHKSSPTDLMTGTEYDGNASGGRVGLASGGDVMPYYNGSAPGLMIPDDEQKPAQLLAQQHPQGSGGQGGLGQAADTAGSLIKLGTTIAGMFSDKRLKENMKPVGKTFDGQTVYSYNYKGDHTPRMGLIAQEVEKKHKKAVGEHGGFKTVDYAAATDASAKRGHFADGGAPDFLEGAKEANAHTHDLYANEDEEAGTMLRSLSGSPPVPEQQDNTDSLAQPAPQPMENKLSNNSAPDAGPIASTGKNGTRATRNNNPANIEAGSFAKKMPGYVGSDGRFAVFGSPEAGRNAQIALLESYVGRGLDTPAKIANKWAPGSEKGNNPAAYAKSLANSIGIGVDDPVPASALPQLASAQAKVEGWRPSRAVGGPIGGGSTLPSDIDEEQKKAQVRALLAAARPPASNGPLQAVDPDTTYADPNAVVSGTPPAMPGLAPTPASANTTPIIPAAIAAARASQQPNIPASQQPAAPPPAMADSADKTSGLFAPPMQTPAATAPGTATEGMDYTERLPNTITAPANVSSSPSHGFFKGLTHGDASSIIPLLSGLGALASTQTNNPLTALAAGLGAGGLSAAQQQEFRLRQSQSQQQLAQNQQAIGVQQGNYGISRSLLPYEQAQVGASAGLAGASALGARANALNTLEHAYGQGIKNASDMANFVVLAKSYGHLLTPEDYNAMPAPMRATLAQISGESPAPYGASGVAPPITGSSAVGAVGGGLAPSTGGAPGIGGGVAPPIPQAGSSAAPAVASGASPTSVAPAGSLGAMLPDLAKGLPASDASPVVAPKAPPVALPDTPGAAITNGFYSQNPAYQQYLQNTAAAQDNLQKFQQLAPAARNTPLGQGYLAGAEQARSQAAQALANAHAQFSSSTLGSQVSHINDTTNAGSTYLNGEYQTVKDAVTRATDAAASQPLNNTSSEWAKVVGSINALFPNTLPANLSDMQGAAEKSHINRMYLNMLGLGDTGLSARSQSVELGAVNKFGTNDPGPASGYDFAVKVRSLADRKADYYNDFSKVAPTITNESAWASKWSAAHPIQNYINNTVQNTPFAKGMTKEQVASYLPPAKTQAAAAQAIAKGARYINVKGTPYAVVRGQNGATTLTQLGDQ